MEYCPECGTEVEEESQFCPECGTELQHSVEDGGEATADGGEATANGGVATATASDEVVESDGLDTGRAIASGVMGIIVGAVVAFAFTNVGGSSIMFLITLAGVGYFLYSKQETIKLVTGMGLYITALWMPLAPIIFYIPLAGGANTETAAGAGAAIGSVVGMFIYGFIGLIIGLVLFAIGYFTRRGERE